jgi:hypothetical protein
MTGPGRSRPGMTGIGWLEGPFNDWGSPRVGDTSVFRHHARTLIVAHNGEHVK